MDFGGYHVVGYHYDDQRSKLNLRGTKLFKNRYTSMKRVVFFLRAAGKECS